MFGGINFLLRKFVAQLPVKSVKADRFRIAAKHVRQTITPARGFDTSSAKGHMATRDVVLGLNGVGHSEVKTEASDTNGFRIFVHANKVVFEDGTQISNERVSFVLLPPTVDYLFTDIHSVREQEMTTPNKSPEPGPR